MKQKLIDLAAKREAALNRAEQALADGRQEDYTSAMAEVANLNTQIQQVQDLIAEQDRRLLEQQPTGAEAHDMAEERGAILQKGGEVKFTALEVRRAIFNSTTLATGTLVEPAGAGTTIREPLGNIPSSIVDQVYVQDLTGLGSYSEPYIISEFEATGGDVKANAGKARTASADPVFGVAEIKPYELTTTNFVDRNISRLSPAAYFDKIHQMAMRGMRRTLAKLIINGDGQSTPAMFGILNAKNKAGAPIFADLGTAAMDANLLDSFFYAYGSDDAIGPNARMYLTKEDLKAIGKLRNINQERVFKVRPDGSNPNIGTIEDSGVFIPYTIVPKGTTKLFYGDPLNYELGMFGDYTIRVDESIKGVERMLAILGDAMVGGNLIVDKGFVCGSLSTTPAQAGTPTEGDNGSQTAG